MTILIFRKLVAALAVSLLAASALHADVGADNPTGTSGQFNGNVTTACSYDPYTANATRSITDITIAGGVGAYPLAFTRTMNSRYTAGVATPFGPAGSWNHSYGWSIDSTTVTGTGFPSTYAVNYPDGRRVSFTSSTGISDVDFRGLLGVRDRFEQLKTGLTECYVRLPDGGKVWFHASSTLASGKTTYTFTLKGIIDPYGQTTTINTTGTTTTVTEPAGRTLQIVTRTISSAQSSQGAVGGVVVDHVTGSDGRTVQYYYTAFVSANGTRYTTLSSVGYSGDSPLPSTYTYQAGNIDANGRPLIQTCIDPRYGGPMWAIGYKFATGTGAVYGQILSENYFDGTTIGAAVSTLTVINATTRMEMRGDGWSRIMNYSGYKLVRLPDFDGDVASRSYDSGFFVNTVTDGNGSTTAFINNSLTGLVTQMIFPQTEDTPSGTPAGTVKLTYGSATCPDPNNRDINNPYYIYSTTDEGNHTTVYTRDTSKRVSRIDYPDGGFETFTYNSFGQVLTHLLRTGGTESYTYDATGLEQTYRNPSNATGNPTARYSYDTKNRRSVVTDALGTTTGDANHSVGYSYNDRGQLTITTLPVDPVDGVRHTITNTYNPDGTLGSVNDQLYNFTSYTYDDYRRVLTITTPQRAAGDNASHVTYMYYDGNGTGNDYTHADANVTHVTMPRGDKTLITYDGDHRKASVTAGAGTADAATTSFWYDGVGNPTYIFAPKEQTGQQFARQATQIAYDERNRLMSATDSLGRVTSCTYDAAGHKASATRANGQVISYDSYDSMNRLLQQTVKQTPDPDAVTKYTYYTSGLLQTMQDPHLVAISSADAYSYAYDTTGRQTQLTYPHDSLGVQRAELWHYDSAGRNDTFTNRAGKVETMIYDGLNRPTGTSWNDSGLTPSVSYTYDVASRLTTIVNSNATISRTYFYDNLLNTETSTYADGKARTVTYTYDADGNRATIQYPYIAYGFTYAYTNRNQLQTISDIKSTIISYSYDADGNLSTRALANHTSSSYTYDALDRVTNITHAFVGTSRTLDYGYDSVSNRTWTKRDGANGDVFGYDMADQSTSILMNVASPDTTAPGAQTINYDANGNRTSFSAYGPTDTYTTNNLNQYSSRNSSNGVYDYNGNTTTGLDGSGYAYDSQNRALSATKGSSTETFKYDGLGRQVSRVIGSASPIYNVYDGWDLISEYASASNTPTTAYVHGVGGPVKLMTASSTYYYMQDASGSTSHLADSNGSLTEWYRYNLQGTPTINDGALTQSAFGVRHLFAGQQWYSELALYDLRNRFYSPDQGRFIQPDPIGYAGDHGNIYRYCGNNPTNAADPSGLWSIFQTTPYQSNTDYTAPGVVVTGSFFDPGQWGEGWTDAADFGGLGGIASVGSLGGGGSTLYGGGGNSGHRPPGRALQRDPFGNGGDNGTYFENQAGEVINVVVTGFLDPISAIFNGAPLSGADWTSYGADYLRAFAMTQDPAYFVGQSSGPTDDPTDPRLAVKGFRDAARGIRPLTDAIYIGASIYSIGGLGVIAASEALAGSAISRMAPPSNPFQNPGGVELLRVILQILLDEDGPGGTPRLPDPLPPGQEEPAIPDGP